MTHNVDPGCIVAGNPAIVIKKRNMDEFYALHNKGRIYLKERIPYGFKKKQVVDSRVMMEKIHDEH